MKMVAWNVRHGGGTRRIPGIVLALLEQDADLIIISEWRRALGGQMAGVLADHGWRHQTISAVGEGENGLLIASRIEFVETTPIVSFPGARAAAAHARRLVQIEVGGIGVVAVHVPCEGAGRDAVFASVIELARRRRDGPCVVIGDLNATREGSWGDRDGRGGIAGEIVSGGGAALTLGRLASLGFVDAWRRANPDARECSWSGARGEAARIDAAWVSRSLMPRVRACSYSHVERESGLSDHSLLVLMLSPSERAET